MVRRYRRRRTFRRRRTLRLRSRRITVRKGLSNPLKYDGGALIKAHANIPLTFRNAGGIARALIYWWNT